MKEYIGKIRLVLMSVGLAAAFGCANYAPDLDEIHEDLNGKDAWVTSINQQIEKSWASDSVSFEQRQGSESENCGSTLWTWCILGNYY